MNNLPIQWLLTKFFNEYPHYRPTPSFAGEFPSPPISDDEYEPPSDYDTDEDEDL